MNAPDSATVLAADTGSFCRVELKSPDSMTGRFSELMLLICERSTLAWSAWWLSHSSRGTPLPPEPMGP